MKAPFSEWTDEQKAKKRQKDARYRKRHRTTLRERNARYYEENREYIRAARRRAWKNVTPEQRAASNASARRSMRTFREKERAEREREEERIAQEMAAFEREMRGEPRGSKPDALRPVGKTPAKTVQYRLMARARRGGVRGEAAD